MLTIRYSLKRTAKPCTPVQFWSWPPFQVNDLDRIHHQKIDGAFRAWGDCGQRRTGSATGVVSRWHSAQGINWFGREKRVGKDWKQRQPDAQVTAEARVGPAGLLGGRRAVRPGRQYNGWSARWIAIA